MVFDLDKLYNIITDFYSNTQSKVINKRSKYTNNIRRTHYFLYISHYTFNISTYKLAKYVSQNRRSVCRSISITKHYILLYEQDEAEYNSIIEYIKKEDSDMLPSNE